MDELIQILKDERILNDSMKVSPWCDRKISEKTRDMVMRETSFLEYDAPVADRINIAILGYTDQPHCSCGNPLKYARTEKDFLKSCSPSCASKNTKEKRLDTFESKYGARNFFPNISKEQRSANSRKGQKLAKKAVEQKYGVSNVMHVPSVKEKHLASVQGIERKKFGVGEHHAQSHYTTQQVKILSNLEAVYREHVEGSIPITVLSERYGFSTSLLRNKLVEAGYDIKIFSGSLIQRQFFSALEECGAVSSDRKVIAPKEIDIFFPDKMVGVEVDGLFWHSTTSKNDNTHLEKYDACKEAGVRLLRFTDKEITDSPDICTSIVKNALGLVSSKLSARKGEVSEIDTKTYREFMEANHLHGYAPASRKFGLFIGGDLVSSVGLSKSRYSKDAQWELTRSASLLDTQVRGGLSKIIAFAVKTGDFPGNIVSFADKRFFTGASYTKSGFVYSGDTKPNYWYVNKTKYTMESRLKYQKHKLAGMLEAYDPELSEKENMIASGYRLYFDHGSSKFIMET